MITVTTSAMIVAGRKLELEVDEGIASSLRNDDERKHDAPDHSG